MITVKQFQAVSIPRLVIAWEYQLMKSLICDLIDNGSELIFDPISSTSCFCYIHLHTSKPVKSINPPLIQTALSLWISFFFIPTALLSPKKFE